MAAEWGSRERVDVVIPSAAVKDGVGGHFAKASDKFSVGEDLVRSVDFRK
jgi:hypothetical protein